MNVVDVHKRINDLAAERGLTPYELAKRSNMALSSLYCKGVWHHMLVNDGDKADFAEEHHDAEIQ